MTDPIREAFERWAMDGRNLGGMEREFAWAAWQQSRREALEWAISEAERWHAFNTAAAIRAAAEEKGK